MVGLSSACDTLFSQLFGSPHKDRIGVALQRSKYLSVVGVMLFNIHLFYIAYRAGQGLCQLPTMVSAGGTRTCLHLHVTRLLYLYATAAESV